VGKLLLVNPGAGAVTEEVEMLLRRSFPDHTFLHFPPDRSVTELLSDQATVIAAGGDGTIGAVARSLAGTGHSFGILSLGTFNNFARGLDLPLELDEAIEVIKSGVPRPVTLGRVNGRAFVEAAAIGFFGDALSFGDAAKSHSLGGMRDRLDELASRRMFQYRISGDVTGSGRTHSVVAANTPSIGALLPVGENKTPTEPYLELDIARGGPWRGLAELLFHALRRSDPAPAAKSPTNVRLDLPKDLLFRRILIETETPIRVYADLQEIGTTPALIEALPAGLQVLLPAA
jgi:diacylglycerol kinase (ATP)